MSAYIRMMDVPESANREDYKMFDSFAQFNEVLERRLSLIREVLGMKGLEYSKAADRYSNFRDAARIENTTAEKALLGMMVKHEVSVRDIVESNKTYSDEHIEEKIGDWINYLILLEGLLKERK